MAVVLADDEHPHLFMPFREGAAVGVELPADHLHGPLYLEFDEGVEHFATVLAELIPAGATVAVDELTGAMRRAGDRLFPGGPPVGRRRRWSAPRKLVKTPDQIACIRKACRITEAGHRRRPEGAGAGRAADRPVGRVRAPRVRTRRHRQHARGDLAGDADLARPTARGRPTAIWRCRC